MQTTVRHKAELEGDPLRHIQPVQFVGFANYCIRESEKFFCVPSMHYVSMWPTIIADVYTVSHGHL